MFGAAYMLVLYRKVIFGEQKNADAAAMPDLTKTEFGILVPLVLMVILFGVAPNLVMKDISPSVNALLTDYRKENGMTDTVAQADIKPMAKAAMKNEAAHD